jgi:hypothetical protein
MSSSLVRESPLDCHVFSQDILQAGVLCQAACERRERVPHLLEVALCGCAGGYVKGLERLIVHPLNLTTHDAVLPEAMQLNFCRTSRKAASQFNQLPSRSTRKRYLGEVHVLSATPTNLSPNRTYLGYCLSPKTK